MLAEARERPCEPREVASRGAKAEALYVAVEEEIHRVKRERQIRRGLAVGVFRGHLKLQRQLP